MSIKPHQSNTSCTGSSPMLRENLYMILDWEVEVIAAAIPGRYIVVTDKPIRESEDGSLDVYLQIKRKYELSAVTIEVPGWCYADA